MKKYYKIILILIILLLSYQQFNAQIKEWKTIENSYEEFTVEIPKENFDSYKFSFKNKKIKTSSYSSYANKTYFKIKTANYREWDFIETVHRYAEDNNAKKNRKKFGSMFGDYFRFIDKDGYLNTIATFSTNKKYYVFHVTSEFEVTQDADRLINSIKFNKKTKKGIPNKLPKLKKRRLNTNSKPIKRNIPIKSASSKKTSDIQNSQLSDKDGNYPIEIIHTTKPGYTELARTYNISGVIKLKVTFLANGRIGGITPINKLPFGLTNKAIKAARQLKFTPLMRNGVKYSVRKVVAYNFNIY